MLLGARAATAQARWSRQAGGPGPDEAARIALDADGNAYVVGNFAGEAKFGSVALGSPGKASAFLVKYDAQGTALWGQQASGAVGFADVVVDADGNAYALGTFSGSTSLGGQALVSQGSTDLLLVKYDAQGQALWSRQGGSWPGSSLTGAGVALDARGNPYVVGTLSGTAGSGSGTLTSEAVKNIYVAAYSAQGRLLWAEQGGGKSSESRGAALGLDAAGNVYLTGSFSGTAAFGASVVTSAANQGSILLAKCDAAGAFGWAVVEGGPGTVTVADIAVDGQGNSVLTGSIGGDQAPNAFGPVAFAAVSGQDGFVVKHNAAGAVPWANQVAGADTDYGTSVALDNQGNVYTTGVFASAPTQWGTTRLAHVGGKNAYIVKYDPQGRVLAAQREGACGGTISRGIAVNARQEIYIAGSFYDFASFVATVFKSQASSSDVFVAKVGDLTTPSTPDGFSCSSLAPPAPGGPPPPPHRTPPPTPPPTPPTPTPPSTPAPPAPPPPTPAPSPTPAPLPAPPPAAPEVFIPNVLTPNGDGLNDKFQMRGLTDNFWSLAVYNRWGKELYRAAAYQQDWDAAGLPAGTYYYVLRHASGRDYKGWIEVVR